MNTSAKIDGITQKVRAEFAAADALAALYTEHSPIPGTSPASRIAAAVKRDAIHAAAPVHANQIRLKLKSVVKDAVAAVDAIRVEAMQAQAVADFITAKADTLPASLPASLHSAALSLRDQPSEAALVARQLQLASDAATKECDRLNATWRLKMESAATVAAAQHSLRIFKAADMPRHVATYERLVVRAKAGADGVRKRLMSTTLRGR